MSTKFIFVTGGVLSGVGKGIIAASLGNILKNHGHSIFIQKFDPYLNVDAGTLNPAEHGECFVTADGKETDLDLGHYERFLDIELTKDSSVMSGVIYQTVIENERKGKYLGKTIQVIPHVTDEIKRRLYEAAKKSKARILITEIGGTVGDIEAEHFLEAARQVALEQGSKNAIFVQVAYLPFLESSQELKTKPVQNALQSLRSRGIQPAMVFCRSDKSIDEHSLSKIALFGGLKKEAVVGVPTLKTIYAVPELFKKLDLDKFVLKTLGLKAMKIRANGWQKLVKRIEGGSGKNIKIGLVGKYMTMSDTYISVVEALKAACYQQNCVANIIKIDSEYIQKNGVKILKDLDAICVPGGFGSRGIEGIISAINYARTNNIPFLGLCLGMQLSVIEYARNVLKIKDANSTEFNLKAKSPVINLMEEQTQVLMQDNYGATMRLGSFKCKLAKNTKALRIYGKSEIVERHRHRYEFNNQYRSNFAMDNNFVIAGENIELNLVELIELKNHPYFLACQYHPEFTSRPLRPHPLFLGLINACVKPVRNKTKNPKSTHLV
ncbi:CTP synthase [Candidatus Berkelbacteria bacterium]|nr:CTP synthase [Candidatus Berkelbacteria bacterium]